MTDQSRSCERAIEENSRVVVESPTSWRDRRRACCNGCGNCFRRACEILGIILGFLIITQAVWLIPSAVLSSCQAWPSLTLEDVNIHNMVVYQNTTGTPYQVRSEFSVNLTAWNENEVTKCFNTFRRLSVSVEFKGQQIVQQEVPLGFGLKPLESRTVMLDLRGDGYPLKKELGFLLDLELRNSSVVGFVITFKSRVMRNDRKARWIATRCDTIAKTPPNGNFFHANSTTQELLISLSWRLAFFTKSYPLHYFSTLLRLMFTLGRLCKQCSLSFLQASNCTTSNKFVYLQESLHALTFSVMF